MCLVSTIKEERIFAETGVLAIGNGGITIFKSKRNTKTNREILEHFWKHVSILNSVRIRRRDCPKQC